MAMAKLPIQVIWEHSCTASPAPTRSLINNCCFQESASFTCGATLMRTRRSRATIMIVKDGVAAAGVLIYYGASVKHLTASSISSPWRPSKISFHIYVVVTAAEFLNMIRFTLLFKPAVRVWNLRFVLLGSLASSCFLVWGGVHESYFSVGRMATTGACCLMFLHHLLVVVRWPLRGLALLELGWTLLEIAGICYLGIIVIGGGAIFSVLVPLFLVPLSFSVLFRMATIKNSSKPILRQQLVFLGGCAPTHPPYTPLRILLNRSIAQPLVRGEARYIMVVRAMILSLIAIGVPAFAIFSIIITPLTTQIYTRDLRFPLTDATPPGNATILLSPLDGYLLDDSDTIQIHVATREGVFKCQLDLMSTRMLAANCASLKLTHLTGPCGWLDPSSFVSIVNVSISLLISPDVAGVYIRPAQGNLSPDWTALSSIPLSYSAVPLFPGSNLSGVFSWTRRDILSETVVWGSSRRTTVFTADVTGLQTTGPPTNSRVATLTLFQQSPNAERLLQDTVDATAITGIATFGGFWTFLNGAFALFFGANVIYFMFGRRPLSALGVVHMFQRRQLVRQWHEDFPAIHTEGGIPGFESAGIVAFIRERLVDLGDDPRETEDRPSDIEAQTSKVEKLDEADNTPSATLPTQVVLKSVPSRDYLKSTQGLGYILDEIPLLDVDLGVDEISYEGKTGFHGQEQDAEDQ
ncbi:hypothetical protein B0H19DRAFT_1239217 [Mycena capillaripes]|nr:hypothetical protein B0H19DRAFT_1239217 [Mycena capillaripes]